MQKISLNPPFSQNNYSITPRQTACWQKNIPKRELKVKD
jgi:hypothetical protein